MYESLSLFQQKKNWKYLEEYHCCLLERVAYCLRPEAPKEQCMNIFVPEIYLNEDGSVGGRSHENGFTAATVPVIFENGLAGYQEAEPFGIEDHRSAAKTFLEAGFVYVSCGCRGRSSLNQEGVRCGKSPLSLADLKAGVRFLKHLSGVIPGDMGKIISVGISAGGAMSSLLGVTGNSPLYDKELERMGAILTETDHIFAAQCYCPIIDLDHADLAYEWMFQGKTHYTGMPFVGFGEGELTPYTKTLSQKMAAVYPAYFNSLGLRRPGTGQELQIGSGREGSACGYLVEKLEESAAKYLSRLEEEKGQGYVRDYLQGKYQEEKFDHQKKTFVSVPGIDKRSWLSWEEGKARISSLDEMLKSYHLRLKKCPAFDDLDLIQAENQEFGTPDQDKMHFNTDLAAIMEELVSEYPEESRQYLKGYQDICGDKELADRKYRINPLNFIGTGEKTDLAPFFRIRVGSRDADTSLMMTMILALKLMETGKVCTDYEIVWDEGHGRADYPGEVTEWVQRISSER